jgi:hypothetical protein
MQPQMHLHGKKAYRDLVLDQEIERWIGALREDPRPDPEPTVRSV